MSKSRPTIYYTEGSDITLPRLILQEEYLKFHEEKITGLEMLSLTSHKINSGWCFGYAGNIGVGWKGIYKVLDLYGLFSC